MGTALRDLIGKICFVYLDDVIISSKTPEEHSQNLKIVLLKLQKAELILFLKKCSFFKKENSNDQP